MYFSMVIYFPTGLTALPIDKLLSKVGDYVAAIVIGRQRPSYNDNRGNMSDSGPGEYNIVHFN